MNKAEIEKMAKHYLGYQVEGEAKRRNLGEVVNYPGPELTRAGALNDATMLLIRTEAKGVAIRELTFTLGINGEFNDAVVRLKGEAERKAKV